MKNLVLKKSSTGKIMRIEPLGVEPELGKLFFGAENERLLKKTQNSDGKFESHKVHFKK
jgi:hypothetical protein